MSKAQTTYDQYDNMTEREWTQMTEEERIEAMREVIYQQFKKKSALANDGHTEDQNRHAAISNVTDAIDKQMVTFDNFKGLLSTVEKPFWQKLMT